MTVSRPPRESYSVCVRYRHIKQQRLNLRQGLRTLDEAFAYMSKARALRFHDPEAVFVVNESDGTIVEEP
jgi:hypothetical protein